MRICYLAWHGSIHTRRWAAWFAARGHEVHVVTCGDAAAQDLDNDGNLLPLTYRVHDLGRPRAGKFGYLLKRRRARRIVHRIAPDVLHAHWLTSYGMLALAADQPGTPLVVTAHGDDVLIAPNNPLLRWLVQRVLRRAELITVPGEPMRHAVSELLDPAPAPAAGIAVFQYGVEVQRLTAVGNATQSERGEAGHPFRIVSARAMLDLYRIDALLDALALLAERDVHFHCDLLGDGPAREALQAQARRVGIADRCTFHGAVTPAVVEQYVAAADVYASVSMSDGVSLALLEALALGTIPVLSDIPANRPWVRDGATGVLVDIDPVDIADGIELAAALDRQQVARDNRQLVAQHADRDTNLAACELLIDSLIGVTWDGAQSLDADVNPSAAA